MKKKTEREQGKVSISWIKEQAKYYQPLKDGEATREIEQLIGRYRLLLGWHAYCTIKHLIAKVQIPIQLRAFKHIRKQIHYTFPLLSESELDEILLLIKKRAEKKQKAMHKLFLKIKDSGEYLIKTYKRKGKIASDFLIYYLQKTLPLYKVDRWQVIFNFFKEQELINDNDIYDLELETAKDPANLKIRYQRTKKHIPKIYLHLLTFFPAGHDLFKDLPYWDSLPLEQEKDNEYLLAYNLCDLCIKEQKIPINCTSCLQDARKFKFVLFPSKG